MMLSPQQKRLLELLKMYGSMKPGQAEALLNMEFRQKASMDVIIRQLKHLNKIRQNDNYLSLVSSELKRPEQELISAIDVMLCFSDDNIQLHKSSPEPFLLTFFKENSMGKLCRYDICRCEYGREQLLSARLEGINEKYRTIIIMLLHIDQQKNINVSCNHTYAISENGVFKFYKPKEEVNGF